jgi:fructosamine-3-kinase
MNERRTIRLQNTDLRKPVEKSVSAYLQRKWRVSHARDMSDYACHPCAILSDNTFRVFAKFSEEPDATRQFEIEKASLEYLSRRAEVLIPTPIGVIPLEHGALFVMEALNAIERNQLQWRQIGKALARIHRVKSDHCGFHTHNYFGPLEQDNTPVEDWATFYGEYRLRPRLRMAVDSGHLPSSLAAQVETIINRLPELCGPEVTPTLLHGDAQQNNFVSTTEGAYVIDPAIHYGNPELDLAYVDYFQPVPEEVFDAYREEMPIDPGFAERRSLWRISGYLAGIAVEGSYYLGMLTDAVQKYL